MTIEEVEKLFNKAVEGLTDLLTKAKEAEGIKKSNDEREETLRSLEKKIADDKKEVLVQEKKNKEQSAFIDKQNLEFAVRERAISAREAQSKRLLDETNKSILELNVLPPWPSIAH